MTDDPEKIFKMDKKSFPASFAANVSKTLSLDSSTKSATFNRQDGTSGSQVSKVQQRTPSRYRGNASNQPHYPRNESSFRNYKPPYPKGNADRRGKSRGGPITAEAVVKSKETPEAGSLQSPGGRKQNFDDLWGFRFAPRENRGGGYSHGRSHPPGGGNWRYHFANAGRAKKDFLLANCQFLVRMGEDYAVYLADPNLLVNWDFIEYVRIRIDGEIPKCPICLDFPVAAKITKCGHIYCWSCFLHYFALSDHKIRTCPICHEPVARKDLKSVSLIPQDGIQIGSRIEMQLMVRMKDTAVVSPVEKVAGWETKFCKIMQVTPSVLIQTVLAKEHEELDFAYITDPEAPEVCFIQEALEELVKREASLLELQSTQSVDQEIPPNGLIPVALETVLTTVQANSENLNCQGKSKPRNDSISSNSSEGLDDGTATHRQVDMQGDCYFYQMSDGRNVFLHPLNMAMLWRELGSDPEKWPQVLTFRVIDVESKSATEDIQKRMKFVRHLPKNGPFELVEVSMEEWGISPEVFLDFTSQIRQREHRRQTRAKEEKIMEKKQREKEAMEFNKFRQLPQISSPQDFPAFAGRQELGLTDFSEEFPGPPLISIPEGQPDEPLTIEAALPTSSSFAQIAGKAPMKKSPTFPIPSRSTWGSGATVAAVANVGRQSDSENDLDDYIPVPNYRASVSDAIEKAMAGLALKKSGSNEEELSATSAGGNRKKKNKKGKVLFATGMGSFQ